MLALQKNEFIITVVSTCEMSGALHLVVKTLSSNHQHRLHSVPSAEDMCSNDSTVLYDSTCKIAGPRDRWIARSPPALQAAAL